jgi:hypothetical protein
METINSVWTVQYSPSQKAMHIETLAGTIQESVKQIVSYPETNYIPDYLLIGVAESRDAAYALKDKLIQTLNLELD